MNAQRADRPISQGNYLKYDEIKPILIEWLVSFFKLIETTLECLTDKCWLIDHWLPDFKASLKMDQKIKEMEPDNRHDLAAAVKLKCFDV